MVTDLNILQTTVVQNTLDLDTQFVDDIVAEVFEDLQHEEDAQKEVQATRKEKDKQILRKACSNTTRRLSTNPFDDDSDVDGDTNNCWGGGEKTSFASARARDNTVINPSIWGRRTSLNPFDEDYSSGDGDGDGDGEDKDEDVRSMSTQSTGAEGGGDNEKHRVTSADKTHCTPLSPASVADKTRVTLPPPPVASSASQRSCPCCFESIAQRRISKVHSGFYQAYISIRLEVFRALILAIAETMGANNSNNTQPGESSFYREDFHEKYSSHRPLDIHICGHSLGRSAFLEFLLPSIDVHLS